MGNVPRAGIEPMFLLVWASVLIITPHKIPDVTTLYTPTYLCGSLSERSVQTDTLLTLDPAGIVTLLSGHLMLTITYAQICTLRSQIL